MILDHLFHLFEPAFHLWHGNLLDMGGEAKTQATFLGWHGCCG